MIKYFLFFICIFFLFPKEIFASIDCDNRYATIVNPLRSRNLWFDKSLEPLKAQYNLIKENDFPATWLVQYDALEDKELLDEIKQFDGKQEIGVFLEVSQMWGNHSRVIYPYDSAWFDPNAVFLSAYSQSERKRLIDKLFSQFKERFGYSPKSVGAWWIDSYSLDYLVKKYKIQVALIVADQLSTDNYGVWGQWWGVPYYPSKANILTPASNLANKQDLVIIQWAQRDITLAYGDTPNFSNYSLQANDYIRQGKDTKYFSGLASTYLDCKNPIGQITVGLETGSESLGYMNEYENQMDILKQLEVHVVTMSEFAKEFRETFPNFPKKMVLNDGKTQWILTNTQRQNEELGDYIKYNQQISFQDYFSADKSKFLDRKLTGIKIKDNKYFPYFLGIFILSGIWAMRKKILLVWASTSLSIVGTFGLLLRSNYQYGWKVYFGPIIDNLILVQLLVVAIPFAIIWILKKKIELKKYILFLALIPLTFGFDFLISLFRYSFISEKHILGFAFDSFRVLGLSFSAPFKIQIINQDFPAYQASALLRFPYDRLLDNLILSLIIWPIIHIIFAYLIYSALKFIPKKIHKLIYLPLILFFLLYILNMFLSDPRKTLSL